MADREALTVAALAGTFTTTPLMLHLVSGGDLETFDRHARVMAEWSLRTHGYLEHDAHPESYHPDARVWSRGTGWPEDALYPAIDTDTDPILNAVVDRYVETRSSGRRPQRL